MTNNDVLRRLRYIFDLSDSQMIVITRLGGAEETREQISAWLKKEDDPDGRPCSDRQLAVFLNGLIVDKRGRKEGPPPQPEQRLNNNGILKKLKIAFNLKNEELLELLGRAGMRVSPHELTALFRKPGHKHYRDCKDQLLRNFLKGAQLKYRPDPAG